VSDIPWPRKADVLFGTEGDRFLNACLNFAEDEFHLYATGYRSAAEHLFRVVDTNLREQDTLVYPIVFLWRQYLELSLKNLVRTGNLYVGRPAIFPMHHRIKELWARRYGHSLSSWSQTTVKTIWIRLRRSSSSSPYLTRTLSPSGIRLVAPWIRLCRPSPTSTSMA
jgi:hypothetical protein